MSYYNNKYEFVGQDSAGSRGGEAQIQVIKSSSLCGCLDGFFHGQLGTVPIAISVETSRTRLFSGTKLDVPRLAAPRGPARGRARANLRGLIYRMSAYDSGGAPARAAGPPSLERVGSFKKQHDRPDGAMAQARPAGEQTKRQRRAEDLHEPCGGDGLCATLQGGVDRNGQEGDDGREGTCESRNTVSYLFMASHAFLA